jgi:membrane-associated phospholipid phosphatase
MTDFADEAVILPLAVAVGLVLLLLGWRRGAFAWLAALGVTFGTMLSLKLAMIPCGPPPLHTPSGHTAAAAVVCGGLALILGRGRYAGAVPLAAAAAALVVGLSRLVLGLHTAPEVIVGGTVGIAGAMLLDRVAGRPPLDLNLRWIIGTVVAVLVLFHGLRLPAEAAIRFLAFRAALDFRVCQSTKAATPDPARLQPAGSSLDL